MNIPDIKFQISRFVMYWVLATERAPEIRDMKFEDLTRRSSLTAPLRVSS